MYSFPIPNTKLKFYQVFAYGIVLLNITGMFMIQSNHKNIVPEIAIVFIIFVLMCLRDVQNYQRGKRMLPLGLLLIAFGFFWIRYGANWAFVANIALWALYSIAKRKLSITVSDEHVIYPSFPKKTLPWSGLNNVILKDDMLTIDCKNNKVYQHLIQNSEHYADETEFNDFCRKLLMVKTS